MTEEESLLLSAHVQFRPVWEQICDKMVCKFTFPFLPVACLLQATHLTSFTTLAVDLQCR